MSEEKEKKIRITISLKKTVMKDYGVSVSNQFHIEAKYDGELPEKFVETMLEKIKSKVIDMDKEIDKPTKKN